MEGARERGREPVTLRDVVAARERVARFIWPTPARQSPGLSERLGADVWLKPENLQRTGSFKVRGAFNRMLELAGRGVSRVITASAGNHGQGVALAARTLGIEATVVVPESAAEVKIRALRRMGIDLLLRGQSFDEADAAMLEIARRDGLTVVSPYDAAVVAGQGTAGLDFLLERPDLDLLLVPVGAGGLIAGCAVAAKGLNPAIGVVGVQPEASPSMVAALRAGEIVPVAVRETLADGLAGNIAGGELPFSLIQRHVDDVVLVSEEAIADATRLIVEEERFVVEPSGVVGLAALLSGVVDARGRRVGLILSGGNVSPAVLRSLLCR